MTVNDYILIAIGVYLIGGGLAVHTKNFFSAMLFKILPLFSGLALLAISFKVI